LKAARINFCSLRIMPIACAVVSHWPTLVILPSLFWLWHWWNWLYHARYGATKNGGV